MPKSPDDRLYWWKQIECIPVFIIQKLEFEFEHCLDLTSSKVPEKRLNINKS